MIVREYIRKSKTGGTRGIKSRKICKTFLHFSKTDKVLGANIDPWLTRKKRLFGIISQPAITCSKLTIETLEQGVKYVQS